MTIREEIKKIAKEDITEDKEKMDKITKEIQEILDKAKITPVQLFGILEYLKMRLFNRTDEFVKKVGQIVQKEEEKPSE